jgi:hypothetical protein
VQVQTCSLEEIFGCREGRSGAYAKRTSSARWDLDTLTLVPPRSFSSVLARPVCHVLRSDHVASPCPVSPCLRVYVSTCVSLQVEKRTYRQQMGYATAHAAGPGMAPPATC